MSTAKSEISILSVQSSGQTKTSSTRTLSAELIAAIKGENLSASVIDRDLANGMPFVDGPWIDANFTPQEERTASQTAALNFSESLIEEIEASDLIIIGAPMYNFSIPASLKAWIDQITRARRTFAYTANGPQGLLKDKHAVLVIATGGVSVGSEFDFSTNYLKHALSFIGVTDITIIAAEGQAKNADEALAQARAQIDALVAEITINHNS